MTADDEREISEQLRANYQAQCDAMVSADVGTLRDLLAAEFTLTHMTGYRQPKTEWLDDIATGRMVYHSIHNMEITTDISTGQATLTARSHTHATIWGADGTWPLQLRIDYSRTRTGWTATHTVASTW
ncbi:nuclear transport factor 2 family protein [Microbacterium sp. LMI1-1-1.1]|uniref:nuclear transport factor 2 family protein n=1 Tax=Microbacterium sp. LMI1-1-1.1 TaxID=3135223 RepID=UPI0034664C3A